MDGIILSCELTLKLISNNYNPTNDVKSITNLSHEYPNLFLNCMGCKIKLPKNVNLNILSRDISIFGPGIFYEGYALEEAFKDRLEHALKKYSKNNEISNYYFDYYYPSHIELMLTFQANNCHAPNMTIFNASFPFDEEEHFKIGSVTLKNSNFFNAKFIHCHFSLSFNADNANLSNTSFKKVRIVPFNMRDDHSFYINVFTLTKIVYNDWSIKTNMPRRALSASEKLMPSFIKTNLSHAKFQDCHLCCVDFTKALLKGTVFKNCILWLCKFPEKNQNTNIKIDYTTLTYCLMPFVIVASLELIGYKLKRFQKGYELKFFYLCVDKIRLPFINNNELLKLYTEFIENLVYEGIGLILINMFEEKCYDTLRKLVQHATEPTLKKLSSCLTYILDNYTQDVVERFEKQKTKSKLQSLSEFVKELVQSKSKEEKKQTAPTYF